MAAIIKIKNLSRNFGKIKAVDNISLNIDKGEIFGLLGPNGAGKTTTINMLITITKPSSGEAEVNSYSIKTNPGMVRKSIGIVFQDFSVDTILTGRENLEMSARLYGLPKEVMNKRIEELLKLVDLEERANSLVKTYSGGMKRRLELIRGILHHPAVLFLDEPTLGLDPQSRAKIWEYIKKMARTENTTIVLTTHYMEEAEMMCDRIAIIDRGKIKTIGTPDVLKESIGGDIVQVWAKHINEKMLRKLKFVRSIKIDGEKATIKVKNAPVNLPMLMKKIKGAEKVEVRSASLNDVFLDYTGRSIRDEAENGSWFEEAMRYRTQKR